MRKAKHPKSRIPWNLGAVADAERDHYCFPRAVQLRINSIPKRRNTALHAIATLYRKVIDTLPQSISINRSSEVAAAVVKLGHAIAPVLSDYPSERYFIRNDPITLCPSGDTPLSGSIDPTAKHIFIIAVGCTSPRGHSTGKG